MAPRPITIIVAKELSEVPLSVLEQRRLAEEEERENQKATEAMLGELKLGENGIHHHR